MDKMVIVCLLGNEMVIAYNNKVSDATCTSCNACSFSTASFISFMLKQFRQDV